MIRAGALRVIPAETRLTVYRRSLVDPKMVLLIKLLDMFRELKTIFPVTKYIKLLHNGCLKF